jgi:hypothetical protein
MKDICRKLAARVTSLHRSEGGQAFVLWAFGLLALLGVTALTIDVGMGYSGRAKAQAAADSAGYAAALVHMLEKGSDDAATAAAFEQAAENGYNVSDPDTNVVVNIPPKSGPHAGDSFFVEVLIDGKQSTYFASVLGMDVWDVGARSVATASTEQKPYGIITLDPDTCQATRIDGSVNISVIDAGTFTQSSCTPNAFHSIGTITVESADNDVVGDWSAGGKVTPPPTKAYPIVDPLAGVDPPIPPSEPVWPCPAMTGGSGTVTLKPGRYNCLIDPPGDVGLKMEEGNYYFAGGMKLDGGGEAVFGKGQYTFGAPGISLTGNGKFTAIGATFFIKSGCGVFAGTGEVNMEAPTDPNDPYYGVLIFQYRDNACTLVMTGNSASGGWGTVYAPAAMIDFSGNGTTSFQFVSKTFYAHGQSTATIVYRDNFPAQVPYIWIVE